MNRHLLAVATLFGACVALGCGPGSGVECGPGTVERAGACSPIDALGICGEGTVEVDGECRPGVPGDWLACGLGTVDDDGVCVPDPGAGGPACGLGTELVDGACVAGAGSQMCPPGESWVQGRCRIVGAPKVDHLQLQSALATPLAGGDLARVNHALDITLRVAANATAPVDLPVAVGLYAADLDHHCRLGILDVPLTGEGEVEVRERLHVEPACLETLVGGEGLLVAGTLRSMALTVQIDPHDQVHQDTDGGAEAPPLIHVPKTSLVVAENDGVDVELYDLGLQSSVVVLERCVPAPDGSPHPCLMHNGTYRASAPTLSTRLDLRAHGAPAFSEDLERENVIAGHPVTLAYAVRPTSGGAWVPVMLRKRAGQLVPPPTASVDFLTTRSEHHLEHSLELGRACVSGGCDAPGPIAWDLMLDGAWAEDSAFDLRLCLSTEIEGEGYDANNCRTTKFLVVRPGQQIAGQTLASDGVQCADSEGGSSFCWSYKSPSSLNQTLGSEGSLQLKFQAGSFTRLDLTQAVSKHDVLVTLAGKWRPPSPPKAQSKISGELEVFYLWAYGAIFLDPDDYSKDPDAPKTCTCEAMDNSKFETPSTPCVSACKKTNPVHPHCTGKTGIGLQRCRRECILACKSVCKYAEGDGKSTLGCVADSMTELVACECRAYYDYGMRVMGFDPLGISQKDSGDISFEFPITYGKELSKSAGFSAGPFSVEIGARVGVQVGVVLGMALHGQSGNIEPSLPHNRCAVDSKGNLCGQISKDASCYCDAACAEYGDCCEDYQAVCLNKTPTLQVVDVSQICFSENCKESLANSNFVGSLTGKITPLARAGGSAWLNADVWIGRGSVSGEITLVDLRVPFQIAGRFGLIGTPSSVREIGLVIDATLDWSLVILKGYLKAMAQLRVPKFCGPIPCGWNWETIWDMTLVSFDGWPFGGHIFDGGSELARWRFVDQSD